MRITLQVKNIFQALIYQPLKIEPSSLLVDVMNKEPGKSLRNKSGSSLSISVKFNRHLAILLVGKINTLKRNVSHRKPSWQLS